MGGGGLLGTGDARFEELLLGGSLGGRDGFGLGGPWARPVSCAVPPSPSTARCIGGGGRCSVFNPVRLALYGTGGPASFTFSPASVFSVPCTAPSADSTTVSDSGAPRPRRSGVIWFGRAAPPWKLTFLGGGPKDVGSFKVARGREM